VRCFCWARGSTRVLHCSPVMQMAAWGKGVLISRAEGEAFLSIFLISNMLN
jgi:hypothetical protein